MGGRTVFEQMSSEESLGEDAEKQLHAGPGQLGQCRKNARVASALSVSMFLSLAMCIAWRRRGAPVEPPANLDKTVRLHAADEAIAGMDNMTLEAMMQQDAEHLDKGHGYSSVFYHGCVDFAKQYGGGNTFLAALPKLISQCKTGIFTSSQAGPVPEDPNLLAAECDRMKRQIELQARLLGEKSFSTPEKACTVIVDLVLPIDEEPPCMRYVEDITHMTNTEPCPGRESWPGIMKAPNFKDAFLRVCLDQAALDLEAEGKGAPGQAESSACQTTLEKLLVINIARYGNLAGLFAEICPVLGMPVAFISDSETIPTPTTRGSTAAMLQRASKLSARRLNQSAALMERSGRVIRARSLSAKRVLENTLAAKGRSHRRLASWSSEEDICCEEKAYSHEGGSQMGLGVNIGASYGKGYGFQSWQGTTCVYQILDTSSLCTTLDPSPGIEVEAVGFGHGWFDNVQSIPGRSVTYTLGGHALWVFSGGYGLISSGYSWRPSNLIGRVLEWSFAKAECDIDSMATACAMGLDLSRTMCKTKVLHTQTLHLQNVKNHCPGSSCFPADAKVTTPSGSKLMQDLVVSDRVLAADSNGNIFFDHVYFFGHADLDSVAPYVVLSMVSLQMFHGQWELDSSDVQLEISADHFMPVCVASREACDWRARSYKYARALDIGSYVWVVGPNTSGLANQSSKMQLMRVKLIKLVDKKGMYNPYTLSGNIVVNSVVASAHSSWVLDRWMPTVLIGHLPAVYQAMFFPGRVLYSMVGSLGADVLGMNNPQHSPGATNLQQSPDTLGNSFFFALCLVALGSRRAPRAFKQL